MDNDATIEQEMLIGYLM